MPYIGNNLATQFQAFATQTITGDGSTGYTLDRAVANGKELLVYINNVKQEEGSGKAYTASGTTITFSEAVASGDSCYLVYMGSAQQTVTAPAGSIVSGQIANATLALPSGLTTAANTGIGTTSPDGALHVKGISDHGRMVLESGGTSGADNNMFMQFHNSGGTEIAQIEVAEGASNEGQIVFKTGGTTTAMTIDKDGQITKPLQPMFSVDGSASYVAYNDGDVLAFNDESSTGRFDNGGNFNTSTYTFTVPITGRYFVSAFAIALETNYTGGLIIQHRNSGGTVIESLRGYQVESRNSRVSLVINCTASDTLRVTTQNAASWYLGNGYGRFSGFLIG